MKTSTETRSIAKIIGEERAVEYIAKAGFDAWDFSMLAMCKYDPTTELFLPADHPLGGKDYLKFARKLKQIGIDNGIKCNQSHAPFPSYIKNIHDFLKRALECTAEAGGEICIIHPDNYKSAEENAEMYFSLIDFAKEVNVKIAAENMWGRNREKGCFAHAACSSPEDFCKHIDLVNDDFLVACFDIGYAELKGLDTSAPEMIKALGPRLKALHIHDVDGLSDSHQIPFSLNIDFDAVARALKEVNYDGYYTLEAETYLKDYTPENVFEGVKDLAQSAIRFEKMCI